MQRVGALCYIASFLALAVAAPAPAPTAPALLMERNVHENAKRGSCTATWAYDSTECGGGEGTNPSDTYAWGWQTSANNGYAEDLTGKQASGNDAPFLNWINVVIHGSDYGGTWDLVTNGTFDTSNESWRSCSLYVQGTLIQGTVLPQYIDSGTCSNLDDYCEMVWEC